MAAGPSPSPGRGRLRAAAIVVALSATMTGLNAVKPLHMDDAVYAMFARHLANHPADPYGFEVSVYWAAPRPAMDVLAPTFLPYYWSRALLAHPGNLFLQKVWLFPFPLMLISSTWSLSRRFARGFEAEAATLVAFSPAILPSLNYMLDVPALALGLLALAVFAGGGRGAGPIAGLLAGAAIDTKWTGFLAPAAIGLYAITGRGRRVAGLVAIGVAAAVFVGWEAWIGRVSGGSHFLHHSAKKVANLQDSLNGIRAVVAIVGGVAPATLVVALLALRRPVAASIAGGVAVAGLAGIAAGVGPQAVFLPFGVATFAALIAAAGVLLVRAGGRWRGDRASLFLALWLALEVVGFFALSPYSAVRRVLGIAVVATLLASRLASITGRARSGRRVVWGAVGFGVVLGLFYFGVDFHEASVLERAAGDAAREAKERVAPGRTAWFVGRYGFRHYAEAAGLTPVSAGRSPLEPGDVLVVQEATAEMEPRIAIDPTLAEVVADLRYDDPPGVPPFRTNPPYYAGKEPIRRREGPRAVVRVYRVVRPFTPMGLIPASFAPPGRPAGALMVPGRR